VTTAFQPSAFQGYAFQIDPVTGSIYVIDENDVATLMGNVSGGGEGMDMHDGFKRHKAFKKLQDKIDKAQFERDKLFADINARRRLSLREMIAPETIERVKEIEVEYEEEVEKPLAEIENAEQKLNRLLLQQQYMLRSIVQKQATAQFEAYMAKLKATYEQNLEDEETLLMLL
jgi:Fe-S cluster assembly iron-binding protein IscA